MDGKETRVIGWEGKFSGWEWVWWGRGSHSATQATVYKVNIISEGGKKNDEMIKRSGGNKKKRASVNRKHNF